MSFIKKSFFGPALLCLALMLTAAPVGAGTAEVNRDQVDIKKGQGALYPTIYQARRGETLEILAESGKWLKVETPNGPGWVMAGSLTVRKGGFNTAEQFKGSSGSSDTDLVAAIKGVEEDAPPSPAPVKIKPQPRGKSRILPPGKGQGQVAVKTIFEKRCSACHVLWRPLGRTETPEGWRKIVYQMKSKTNSGISKKEAEAIIDYLSRIRNVSTIKIEGN